MRRIYTEYLDQINKTHQDLDEIYTCVLEPEKELYISNKKKEQIVFLFQQQTLKIKCYKKISDILQSFTSTKPNKLLLFIKIPID